MSRVGYTAVLIDEGHPPSRGDFGYGDPTALDVKMELGLSEWHAKIASARATAGPAGSFRGVKSPLRLGDWR